MVIKYYKSILKGEGNMDWGTLIILIILGNISWKLTQLQRQINKIQDNLYNDRITQIHQNLSLIKSNLGKPCRLIRSNRGIINVSELLDFKNNIITYKVSTGDNFTIHYDYLEDIELVELID